MSTGESEQRELHSPGGLAVAKVRHTKWPRTSRSGRSTYGLWDPDQQLQGLTRGEYGGNSKRDRVSTVQQKHPLCKDGAHQRVELAVGSEGRFDYSEQPLRLL